MRIVYSWDDGAPQDQRLFELHSKYEIPGMFYVPSQNREGRDVLAPSVIRNAESKYIRFGGHTQNHTYLTEITKSDIEKEIVQNKGYLEDILGHSINDFCLPGGRYTKGILQTIFKYYNTVRTADTMNFKYKQGLLKPTFQFYPRGRNSLLANAIRNGSFSEFFLLFNYLQDDYFEIMRKIIMFENLNESSIVMIWGHSWEIDELGLWKELEDFMIFTQKYSCVDYSELLI